LSVLLRLFVELANYCVELAAIKKVTITPHDTALHISIHS